ncbi:M48 family metalloprotease [Acinetobacter pittii]|uniref:M48 family metalloprotease n=1 Tax=Acinetobacter pittii TaxID=48296 RepID=UPI000CE42117|nr:M48 family metalloprotease [Acinetobacter pittii]MCG5225453.1 M48 family metalloprotease [Acinetobacter pittii]PPC07995.1 peptidase M48 [Acinetobacter pittii]WPP60497.1 M48 family metalloprotease [Acinetobacter pittii]
MKEVSHYLIENKNMAWSITMCLVAVLLTIFILNLILGLLVHFFDYSQPIWWHTLSPYFIALLLFIMVWSVVTELYILRKGGHSLAKQLKARRLVKEESTPEELAALKITEHLAQTFSLKVPTVYVLPDEVGVNALTAGFHPKDIVIILTWGALQNLDKLELYGLLGHEFNQILSGEAVENTKLKILYSGLTTFSQWGSKLAKQGFKRYSPGYKHKFETVFVAVGGVIWLAGSLGVLITRFIKYLTLSGRTFRNDQKTVRLLKNNANTQTLLRIYVHHSGSQIHSAYSESIAHMCFANSLSPQSWMNIHPSIRERIYELNPTLLQDLQLENLKKLRNRPLFSLFHFLEESEKEIYIPWSSPQPLPLLRLSPISFALNDAIKPLSSDVRRNKKRPELIQRALQTATGSRELMVAILMIRQYREFIPKDAPVSHAIIDALLNLDGRIHIQIFHDACKNIGHIPASIARQFLTKLALIIQEDGEIGLLDALLLERVKYELNLMPLHLPTAFEEVKPQIVRLIDALLHVQQINSPNQLEVRERILRSLLNPDEMYIYDEISDEPLDLAEILNDIAGLLLRDRLSILAIAEMCLWSDRIITQDELDVLELLYWRFGFETEEIVDQMQKRNSVMII